jgi:hypothetical protein
MLHLVPRWAGIESPAVGRPDSASLLSPTKVNAQGERVVPRREDQEGGPKRDQAGLAGKVMNDAR